MAALTPSELAARLVVEGSLDKMAGKATERFPVEGVRLTEAQRAELGRKSGGNTIFYALGASGVFMDFQDAATTIWFNDGDSANAMKALEKALKSSYPKASQKKDNPHAGDAGARQRSYDVPLGPDRVAVVDIIYPAQKSASQRFAVQILAYGKGDKKN